MNIIQNKFFTITGTIDYHSYDCFASETELILDINFCSILFSDTFKPEIRLFSIETLLKISLGHQPGLVLY